MKHRYPKIRGKAREAGGNDAAVYQGFDSYLWKDLETFCLESYWMDGWLNGELGLVYSLSFFSCFFHARREKSPNLNWVEGSTILKRDRHTEKRGVGCDVFVHVGLLGFTVAPHQSIVKVYNDDNIPSSSVLIISHQHSTSYNRATIDSNSNTSANN